MSDLLAGGDASTIAAWLDTEIARVYGPLMFIGVGVAVAGPTIVAGGAVALGVSGFARRDLRG